MKESSEKSTFIDKLIIQLASYSPTLIVIFATMLVLLLSLPIVYFITILLGEQYTELLLILSVVLPLLTPLPLTVLFRLTKHLQYSAQNLEEKSQESKQKDVVLFEQSRFALMGEMMTNISEHWKQSLQSISLSVEDAKKECPNSNKNFETIDDNVHYLGATVDNFLSFFDKKTHMELMSMSDIIKEIKSIVDLQMPKDIKFETEIDNSIDDVMISSSISQVILNLINNAQDALDYDLDNKIITLKLIAMEDGVEIVCCDSGNGIDPKIRDAIFEPYFTTKEDKHGRGIGLYILKQIVDKVFDGYVDVGSTSKLAPTLSTEKTCFYIGLPFSHKCVIKNKEEEEITSAI